ncbi:MAG: hypothetical protein GY853_11110 [PVC group bacterium]|nr:hypothetical protein [PVC group bacterium]
MKKLITFLIILMGVSCCSAQVLLIREFLIVFYGNEMIIGIILGNWLLLEAAGSFIFGKFSEKLKSPHIIYAIILILSGILFPLSIVVARNTKYLLNTFPGEGIGLSPTFLSSLAIMLPLGILLGGLFPLSCRLYKDISKKPLTHSIGKTYFLEGAGFGISGIIITFLFVPYFKTIHIAFILSAINIIAAWILIIHKKNKLISISTSILLILCICFGSFKTADNIHKKSIQSQWENFNIIDYKNSIYGNITVTQQKEQYTFFCDGVSFMSIPVPNLAFTHDIVNFSLGASPLHENILVLGPGLGGIINNILQFPIKQIHYAELDPMIISMAKRYKTNLTLKELSNKKVNIHHIDGRLFLRNTPDTFDAIIINLPAPSTLNLNRFYTQEFFSLVKEKLAPSGVLCFQLPGAMSYLSKEQRQLNKCILDTLKLVFSGIKIIPGHYNLYLCSPDKELKITPKLIQQTLKKYNIKSPLFTDFYIQERLNSDREQWFYESLRDTSAQLNKDLKPAGVFYSLSLWNALFTPTFQKIFQTASSWNLTKIIIVLLPIWLLALIILWQKKKKGQSVTQKLIPALVMTSGFSGMSLNLILILSLQTFYGYVYLYIGVLIGAFMIGLTSGSMLMTKQLPKIQDEIKTILKIDLIFALFCLAFPVFILGLQFIIAKNFLFPLILFTMFIISVGTGFFTGAEFPLANKIYLQNSKNKNILYSFDMLGSFLGAILVSILLIPILGIINALILIAAVKGAILTLFATTLFWSERKCPGSSGQN